MGYYGSSNNENLYSHLQRIKRDFDWCYWWFKDTFLYFKRSFYNQILHYKIILDLCENEMISITFFGICEESMIGSENLEIEKWYEGEDIVPVTRSSLHLVPLSSPSIGNPLTSKDESYVNIQSISLCDLCIQLVLVGWYG